MTSYGSLKSTLMKQSNPDAPGVVINVFPRRHTQPFSADANHKEIAKTATKKLMAAAGAESIELLDGGEETYPLMLAAITKATRNVHLETYAFSPSGIGERFIDALALAAGRGVAAPSCENRMIFFRKQRIR